ncbi:MAG: tRNA (guanosine(46)-N7)-methyltransferase TrmB, partial [Bacteroidota bacterium]
QLRGSKAKKRLTHPKFLRMYQEILAKDGIVNLKTDSPDLYHFTKTVINLFAFSVLEDAENVHTLPVIKPELLIKTHYEGLDIAKSNRIHYLRFKLDKEIPLEKDAQLKQILSESDTA